MQEPDRPPEGLGPADLLLADLVLAAGVATTADVIGALQRCWDDRASTSPTGLVQALVQITGLHASAFRRLEAERDRLVAAAGDDALEALIRHGGAAAPLPESLIQARREQLGVFARIGTRIGAPLRTAPRDRYVDLDMIGRGGMGIVYLAIDTELNRLVALKTVRPPEGSPPEAEANLLAGAALPPPANEQLARELDELKARFLQEAWVTGGLEHPCIVPIYELGRAESGLPYYTMRYVRGEHTLATAIHEVRGRPLEERLRLLDPFLKVCDAIHYAHSRGVIHRDLKPANVMLGSFGEAVLLDWGLAKLRNRDDLAASRWQERIQVLRTKGGLQTDPVAVGTPGYMSPEAVLGRVDELDEKSDVYGLCAMLFEILTGRLPHTFTSYAELVQKVSRDPPPTASSLDPEVPAALSDLCVRGLAREPANRLRSVQELVDAIRRWQTEDAVRRDVASLLDTARTTVGAAERLEGEARLRILARANSALEQVSMRTPDAPAVAELKERLSRLRDEALSQQVQRSTRGFLRRLVLVGAALVGVLLASGYAFVLLERGRTEQAEARTRDLLDRVSAYQDAEQVQAAIEEADALWPVHPSTVAGMDAWLDRVHGLLDRRSHYQRLAATVEGAGGPPTTGWTRLLDRTGGVPGGSVEDATLPADLLRRLDMLQGTDPSGVGLLHQIETRREVAGSLWDRTRATYDGAWSWDRLREALADASQLAPYERRTLPPLLGLVPLGPDPQSGLLEFAHIGSGSVPPRDPATGRLRIDEASAVVLVLMPGTGPPSQPGSAARGALLVSKFELTTAQWRRLDERSAVPSGRGSATAAGPGPLGPHPIASVSWDDASRILGHHRLSLPTEPEWEMAFRAGSREVESVADRPDLGGRANVADASFGASAEGAGRPFAAAVQDGHAGLAPIGSLVPNAWGLHDMVGNVAEWCTPARPVDEVLLPVGVGVARGGSWSSVPTAAGLEGRETYATGAVSSSVGVRPVAHAADLVD